MTSKLRTHVLDRMEIERVHLTARYRSSRDPVERAVILTELMAYERVLGPVKKK